MPTTQTAARTPTPVRPEIQALRAGAVLAVVAFHLWPGAVPGGYIGVDVFFVISGFLITGHLIREMDVTGRVDLRQFWARRARRLLPAAYTVLAVTLVGIVLIEQRSRWQQSLAEIIGSALYVENWVLVAFSVDYQAAENAASAVQHYWTLSVEEQFYLVWPLLVLLGCWLATRWTGRRLVTVTVVLLVTTAACMAFSLWLTASNPAASYFATPARAWQFGAGALLALWEVRPTFRRPGRPLGILATWGGLIAIGVGCFVFGPETPFPGVAALVPVVGTIAIILAGAPAGPLSLSGLMAWRPVQFVGDISYSMYLWHWPPIVLLPLALGHHLEFLPRLGILIVLFPVAWASKRWIEDPVRTTRRFGLRRPAVTGLATLTAAALLTVGAGSGLLSVAREQAREQAATEALTKDAPACFGAASMDPEKECHNPELDGMLVPSPETVGGDYADYPDCWLEPNETQFKQCTFGPVDDPAVPQVVLVGDSHARAMLPAFITLAEQGRIGLHPLLKSSCAWTTGEVALDDPSRVEACKTWRKELQGWLITHAADIDVVVTTGYLSILKGDEAKRLDDMVAAIKPVADEGVPIVGLADNPVHTTDPNRCLEKLERVQPDDCAIDRTKAFPTSDTFAAAADEVAGGVSLDLTDFYCSSSTCPAVIGGVNVYRDRSHLTVTYTRTMAPYILRGLTSVGVLRTR